jgi:hypothetical protein
MVVKLAGHAVVIQVPAQPDTCHNRLQTVESTDDE